MTTQIASPIRHSTNDRRPTLLTTFALVSGILLAIDGVLLDPFVGDSAVARTVGVLALPLAAVGVVGLYAVARRTITTRALTTGMVLNLIGLCALTGVAFCRNFVLAYLDDPLLDAVRDAAPVAPALAIAGVVASIGFIVFGFAMVRFERSTALGYAILSPVSGFAAQMPTIAAAIVQGLGAAAVIGLAWTALRRS